MLCPRAGCSSCWTTLPVLDRLWMTLCAAAPGCPMLLWPCLLQSLEAVPSHYCRKVGLPSCAHPIVLPAQPSPDVDLPAITGCRAQPVVLRPQAHTRLTCKCFS